MCALPNQIENIHVESFWMNKTVQHWIKTSLPSLPLYTAPLRLQRVPQELICELHFTPWRLVVQCAIFHFSVELNLVFLWYVVLKNRKTFCSVLKM